MITELLSPAGDFESLQYAVLYGASAVYFGGSGVYSMRSRNMGGIGEVRKCIDYAHARGVKAYITCNTLPTNAEAEVFHHYVRELEAAGADGIIVADIGAIAAVRRHSKLDVHVSTQAGVTNYAAALAAAELGATRIVLARELPLDEIAGIRAKLPDNVELEVFVHGAMCVSFSGRCLLSKYMTNRDANRGECAQPCRFRYFITAERAGLHPDTGLPPDTPETSATAFTAEAAAIREASLSPSQTFEVEQDNAGQYEQSFILNAQDMRMIKHLTELSQAGANSIKIEGRAKSAYYTAVITNAYAAALKALRGGWNCPEWAVDETEAVSHREYCTGFYFGEPAQSTRSGEYLATRGFCGMVDSVFDNVLYVIQRNCFAVTDTLELLTPGKPPKVLNVTAIETVTGVPTERANIACGKYRLVCDGDFGNAEHGLLRRVLTT